MTQRIRLKAGALQAAGFVLMSVVGFYEARGPPSGEGRGGFRARNQVGQEGCGSPR